MSGKSTSGVESASWKAQGTFAVKEMLSSLDSRLSTMMIATSTVIQTMLNLVTNITEKYQFAQASDGPELPCIFMRARLVEDIPNVSTGDTVDQLDVQVYIPLNEEFVWALTAHIVDEGEGKLTGCLRREGTMVGSEPVRELEYLPEADLLDSYETLRTWFS